MTGTLLADSLASSLSPNARGHLRDARVRRHAEHTVPAESLAAALLARGFSAPRPLLDLEARAGGAVFPGERLLGAFAFLRACSWLRPKDLPLLDGEPAFPVFGNPDLLVEDWEDEVLVMGARGSIAAYSAPRAPAPAYESLEQLLEVEALAPLDRSVHVRRVDALCGETLAGLTGALPHPPGTGLHTSAFAGFDVWVREIRIDRREPPVFSDRYGTFLHTARADILADATALLLADGSLSGPVVPGRLP